MLKLVASFLTSTLVLAAISAQDTMTFAQSAPRMATRISFWGKDFTPLGQACIQFAQPVWKAEYDQMVDKVKGKNLRLGSDFWTSLDANVDMTISGVAVAAGQWYLAMHCSEKGEWSLLLIDPAAIRAKKMDAFQSSSVEAKLSAPLTESRLESSADKLTIELKEVKDTLGAGTLVVTWGTHKLSAPITLAVVKPVAKEQEAKPAEKKK